MKTGFTRAVALLLTWLVTSLAIGGAEAVAACPTAPDRFAIQGAEAFDSRTGLVWQRCGAGQSWDGSGCNGALLSMSHQQAISYARWNSGNAGNAGWRLPESGELLGLVDKACSHPSIDLLAFPGTAADRYWSATGYGGDAAMFVNFSVGQRTASRRHAEFFVRLVRSRR